MIITIDGPAGAGKSTTARALASKLRIAYLDTGATYRAATLKALKEGIDLSDDQALARIATEMDFKMVGKADGLAVLLDGRDVSEEIRTEAVSESTRYAASSQTVRNVLVTLQRRLGEQLGEFVAEGRDQGSVVFPQADVKFYIDARPDVRGQRRHKEILDRGETADQGQVLRSILDRDSLDKNRRVAPLIKPEGAIEIDTSDKTIEQVADEMLAYVEAAR